MRRLFLLIALLAGLSAWPAPVTVDVAALPAGAECAFDGLQVRQEAELLSFTTGDYELVLDRQRNYVIKSLVAKSGGVVGLDYGQLFVVFGEDSSAGESRQVFYEDQSSVKVTGATLTVGKHSASLLVTQTWPRLQIRKIVGFYAGEPYFRLAYHVLATGSFHCERTTLNLGTGPELLAAVAIDNGNPAWKQHQPGKWFNLPRSQADRWFAYVSAEPQPNGLAVIGADPWFWEKLPGLILGSGRKQGGFTVEMIRWRHHPTRTGDAMFFELFLAPIQGDAVKACRDLQKRIVPGL
ncbi:MAG: hypothetical protein GX574_03720 [Lentisphaerae bacterium]|nr:hypothetical protein [Lentisphaerota bacterium]OQC12020.1 MAG: hypothetical protein BWX73_03178 [Lentisphaerae bacterium ADurb.Bin082]HQL87405.1 hypothetical protein [Lentisphaeria bacterium]